MKNQTFEMVDPIEYSELLNGVAKEVLAEEIRTPQFQAVIDAMIDLADGKGHDKEDTRQVVGLAAPQVGVNARIVLIDMSATGALQKQRLTVVINPVVSNASDEMIDGREGCWSCGDVCGNVARAKSVTLSGLDRNGEAVTYELDGFVARIAQHETDHLNGIRFPERIPENEPWRLHFVKPNEFGEYREKWAEWNKLYDRDEWIRLRDGVKLASGNPQDKGA